MRGPNFREIWTADIAHVKSHSHAIVAENPG